MINLTPLSSFQTAALHSLAVFDLDGTVAPNTVSLFWQHVWTHHPSAMVTGPFNMPRTLQWLTDPKAVRRRLESIRETPSFQALAAEFAQTDVERHIYVRSAEEITWRRANLQTVIVVTGAFDAMAEPLFHRLRADRVHSNARFMPMEIHGAKKPDLLTRHYLNPKAGFVPQAVYTDAYSDRFMVEAFDWPEIHLVNPDRKLRKIRKEGWRIVNPKRSNPDFPEAVREYAATVIKGPPGAQTAIEYYKRWDARMRSTSDPTLDERKNILAAAGLYLKEDEGLRRLVVEALGDWFETRCTGLYSRLVARDPKNQTPLEFGSK